MEEDKAGADSSPSRQVVGRVIRVDEKSHAVIAAYRFWMEDRDGGRVSMAEAVRELLVRKAQDVMREDR